MYKQKLPKDITLKAPTEREVKNLIEDVKRFSKQTLDFQIKNSFSVSERLIRFGMLYEEVEFHRGQFDLVISGLMRRLGSL